MFVVVERYVYRSWLFVSIIIINILCKSVHMPHVFYVIMFVNKYNKKKVPELILKYNKIVVMLVDTNISIKLKCLMNAF